MQPLNVDVMRIKWNVGKQGLILLLLAGVLGFGTNALRPDGLSLTEECFKNDLSPVGANQPVVIALDQARELFEGRCARFIDTRSAEEYLWGHIQGAANLPWEEAAQGRIGNLSQQQRDALLVIYADGESCGRGAATAVALHRQGFTQVKVLINGWSLWTANDLPTEIGPPPF